MSSVVVVGTQWGDEGKGKITDFLSENAEVIARYQGGDNAGHTIKFNGVTYKLHLIPSGIFYKDKISVIGNGVVVNPKSLVKELAYVFLTEHMLFCLITSSWINYKKMQKVKIKSVQQSKGSDQHTWTKQLV